MGTEGYLEYTKDKKKAGNEKDQYNNSGSYNPLTSKITVKTKPGDQQLKQEMKITEH